jgi:hypothetical protein
MLSISNAIPGMKEYFATFFNSVDFEPALVSAIFKTFSVEIPTLLVSAYGTCKASNPSKT